MHFSFLIIGVQHLIPRFQLNLRAGANSGSFEAFDIFYVNLNHLQLEVIKLLNVSQWIGSVSHQLNHNSLAAIWNDFYIPEEEKFVDIRRTIDAWKLIGHRKKNKRTARSA